MEDVNFYSTEDLLKLAHMLEDERLNFVTKRDKKNIVKLQREIQKRKQGR